MSDFPEFGALDLEFADGWLTVWFNQPETRNPLTEERARDLRALAEHLGPRRDVRGIVFRGRGGVFCAGGDLKAFKLVFQGGAPGGDDLEDQIIAMSKGAGALFDAIDGLPQFTVMAIEGAAMAGGFGLACCGDYVLAEEGASFALTETAIGLCPAQIAPFVVRRLGQNAARRLMLTAEKLTAPQAQAVGLADAVASGADGVDAALAALQAKLARAAPGAVAETKQLILGAGRLTREQQIQAAAESFARCLLSAEGREGVTSFVEKRKPAWATPSGNEG